MQKKNISGCCRRPGFVQQPKCSDVKIVDGPDWRTTRARCIGLSHGSWRRCTHGSKKIILVKSQPIEGPLSEQAIRIPNPEVCIIHGH